MAGNVSRVLRGHTTSDRRSRRCARDRYDRAELQASEHLAPGEFQIPCVVGKGLSSHLNQEIVSRDNDSWCADCRVVFGDREDVVRRSKNYRSACGNTTISADLLHKYHFVRGVDSAPTRCIREDAV